MSFVVAKCRFEGKWKKGSTPVRLSLGKGKDWLLSGKWEDEFQQLSPTSTNYQSETINEQSEVPEWHSVGLLVNWQTHPLHDLFQHIDSFLICWHRGAGTDEGTFLPKWFAYFLCVPLVHCTHIKRKESNVLYPLVNSILLPKQWEKCIVSINNDFYHSFKISTEKINMALGICKPVCGIIYRHMEWGERSLE